MHPHAHKRGLQPIDKTARHFGSLLTAGPFPVKVGDEDRPETWRWFFPRPADAQKAGRTDITLRPVPLAESDENQRLCSLPVPLNYMVASTCTPTKDRPEPWWSKQAFSAYLDDDPGRISGAGHLLKDCELSVTEHEVGIGIDEVTGAQDGERIYSAHYLRMREEWRLGVVADCLDKGENGQDKLTDLISELFRGGSGHIVVGGQQRLCTARLHEWGAKQIPLPLGKQDSFPSLDHEGSKRWLLKWVLLTPAIWPEIVAGEILKKNDRGEESGRTMVEKHTGGWLPNWVAEQTTALEGESIEAGDVLLRAGPGVEKSRRKGGQPGARIKARLVAAIVPKPIVVTGYALSNEDLAENDRPGAKPTHLAVPAGAVYYFEAETAVGPDPALHAKNLAATLNWHGAVPPQQPANAIKNRRSTIMGEKGFGLGVCAGWTPFPITLSTPTN